MARIMNLVIESRCDPRNLSVIVEPFIILEGTQDPKQALRDAVNEFIGSASEESVAALSNANGYYNWGDAIATVPDSLFIKHGLQKINSDAVDILVDHDEVLCGDMQNDDEEP